MVGDLFASNSWDRCVSSLPVHFPARLTLGKMQNPVRGFLNGTAAIVAVVGLVFLIVRGNGFWSRAALAVFGLGLVGLFLTSSLYHSIPWRRRAKKIMQRVDHSAIFILIAATYTPVAVIILDGWLRWATLAVVWGLALVGIGQHAFFPRREQVLSTVLHTTLGWLALLIVVPIARRIGVAPVIFYAGGGVLYTLGMVFMATGRPRLWPRIFSAHELFHVLVIAAGALHYTATVVFVAPYSV